MISRRICTLFILLAFAAAVPAQNPARHSSDAVESSAASPLPVIEYALRVDSADLSGYQVEMRLRNAADTFRVAMAAHPEYDDRFWRFVEDFRVESPGGRGGVTREDSALWRIAAPGGEAVLRYRIHLPLQADSVRAAYRPFLARTGGLVGGPHSFMYLPGATNVPSRVTLSLPRGWAVATGLELGQDPNVFYAPSADVLLDSPFLIGMFRNWRFSVDGVPHRVVYWPRPNAAPFDTTVFVGGIEKIVRQAVSLFGRLPYRDYSFLYQDGALGALEHWNSVTIGARSGLLAGDPTAMFATTAHEFFHTWNLMSIRPAEWRDLVYKSPPRSRGLWWSEGVTMFYSDLLMRRAGLRVSDSTRSAHLERQLGWYIGSPGNSIISPERVSLFAFGGATDSLGDYSPSTHLQGELLGAMLDLIVRDATNGERSLDDVMRAVFDRFSGDRGFNGEDIERTVAGECGCDVHSFFEAYVRGGKSIEFDGYLRLIGLRSSVTWSDALDPDGHPSPDLRAYSWLPVDGSGLRLGISDPSSVWGKAGLHTGDRILAVNGGAIKSTAEFRGILRRLHSGDTVTVEVQRPAGVWRTAVVIAGYQRPVVRLEDIQGATERQLRLRAQWMAGEPLLNLK
jgi:predicted metalloprotease with PDZ domain